MSTCSASPHLRHHQRCIARTTSPTGTWNHLLRPSTFLNSTPSPTHLTSTLWTSWIRKSCLVEGQNQCVILSGLICRSKAHVLLSRITLCSIGSQALIYSCEKFFASRVVATTAKLISVPSARPLERSTDALTASAEGCIAKDVWCIFIPGHLCIVSRYVLTC